VRRHPYFFAFLYKICSRSLHVIQCRILKQTETGTCPVGCPRLVISNYQVITSAWLPTLPLEVSLRCTDECSDCRHTGHDLSYSYGVLLAHDTVLSPLSGYRRFGGTYCVYERVVIIQMISMNLSAMKISIIFF
jgi:hypothetical protein